MTETEAEVAAVGRWSTNTVAAWRGKPDHPLPWFLVAARFVRYRAGDVKAYVTGVLRQKRPGSAAPRSRRADPPASPPQTQAVD
jgi:hypothetical protein